jgi:hypothetical protein
VSQRDLSSSSDLSRDTDGSDGKPLGRRHTNRRVGLGQAGPSVISKDVSFDCGCTETRNPFVVEKHWMPPHGDCAACSGTGTIRDKHHYLHVKRAASRPEDYFLAEGGWHIETAGGTGIRRGPRVRGVTDLETLKDRIDDGVRGNGHADLSDANSQTLADLFGCSRRTIQRMRRVSPNSPKGEEKHMHTGTPTIAERITAAEVELERQKEITAEVARQVGLTFDDAGVTEAVERFLDEI